MNEMMWIVMDVSGKRLPIRHVPGPEGVRGRNSHNDQILEKLGWQPTITLRDGLRWAALGWAGWTGGPGSVPELRRWRPAWGWPGAQVGSTPCNHHMKLSV